MQPDDGRIVDILVAADEIADFIRGMEYETYLGQSSTRAAVQWQVFVIGEAVRQLSGAFKGKHPTIEWHKIVGARNILAHEYGRIDNEIMWRIASKDVPELAAYLRPLAPPEVEE